MTLTNLSINTLQVYYGTSQIGIGDIAMTYSRILIVDYTTSIYPFSGALTSRKPEPVAPFTNWLKPFMLGPWCLMLGALAICTVVFTSASLLLWHGKGGHLWDLSLMAYAILLRQSMVM